MKLLQLVLVSEGVALACAYGVGGFSRPAVAHTSAASSSASRMPAPLMEAPVATDNGMGGLASSDECSVVPTPAGPVECEGPLRRKPPFRKVMAANRAEIAVRIMRAATELNMETVAIYGYEDRYSQHRWGADQSFMLKPAETAVKAYLDDEGVPNVQRRKRAKA